MVGNWVNYAIVLLTLLFTALGLGFLISLLAKTEMQAVQYAMLLLLGSVFFSGFFLDLAQFVGTGPGCILSVASNIRHSTPAR